MRRETGSKRGRWIWVLLVGIAGFLLGDWHATTSRPISLSPSQNVAWRFSEPAPKADFALRADAPRAMVMGQQFALLSPEPMVSASLRQSASPMAETAAPQEHASATQPESQPASRPAPPASARTVKPAPTPPRTELKSATPIASDRSNRARLLLNDAQIASIKARLHLTPDQESMWPAVETALRNIAYAKTHDSPQRTAGGSAELASLDPDGAAVQGLKSAAVPLIMSFSDEQKNEVRNLAHVMGLDKLAAEF
jgi:hypothetical protein